MLKIALLVGAMALVTGCSHVAISGFERKPSSQGIKCNHVVQAAKNSAPHILTETQKKNFDVFKSLNIADVDVSLFLIFDSMKDHGDIINSDPSINDPERIKILNSRIESILQSGQFPSGTIKLKEINESFNKILALEGKDGDLIHIFNLYSYYKLNTFEITTNLNNAVCGMSDREIFSINLYTGGAFSVINKSLRNGEVPNFEVLITSINSGLAKLAPYKGTVTRGSNLPNQALQEHQTGKTVKYAAYTSTSVNVPFVGDYKFVINSKEGRYIAPLSIHPDEEEVLFKNGSSFVIDSRNENTFKMSEN